MKKKKICISIDETTVRRNDSAVADGGTVYLSDKYAQIYLNTLSTRCRSFVVARLQSYRAHAFFPYRYR